MKATILPVYFPEGRDQDFDIQLERLKKLFAEEADFLEGVALDANFPACDAVVFPQFLGEAYSKVPLFRKITVPILVITSEFGTFSMWDWELLGYLRSKGVFPYAPSNIGQAKILLNAIRLKKEMKESKFLVFQDDPANAEGMQSEIFKRFFWWEDESAQLLLARFGITLQKRSYRAFSEGLKKIADADARSVLASKSFPAEGLGDRQLVGAIKQYMAISKILDDDPAIKGVGINCLNESRFAETTPCLAWNLLFSERKTIWGCEADHLSMLTKFLVYRSLGVNVMMTNLYPFLMGQAALKHERIPSFPEVPDPENHILAAHCGYFGVVPQEFSGSWCLRKKVLRIVHEDAVAIDARLPEGPITLVKLAPTYASMTVVEGEISGYAQYENSDCLNGAVIRIPNGRRLVDNLISHHYIIATGHIRDDLAMVLSLFGMTVDEI